MLFRSTPVERGRAIFFNETFKGNGRTCGTCHREEDNFGLSPNFIATLPADDPLFVAERPAHVAESLRDGRDASGELASSSQPKASVARAARQLGTPTDLDRFSNSRRDSAT